MFNLGLTLITISVIGFLGMTFGPAIITPLFYRIKKYFNRYPLLAEQIESAPTVEFHIPVHNQAHDLEESLISLSKLKYNFKVTVGANACTDHTESIAHKYKADVIVNEIPGKWGMLKDLAAHSNCDWVILLDAGTLVPENFFAKLDLENCSKDVIGIAPRYYPKKLSRIQKLIWKFEAFLKKLENISGGPVSVHGACVLYRREKLQKVFSSLSSWRGHEMNWQNDDVVIPLWMRFQNPQGRIHYRYDLCVDDWDIHIAPASSARRKRLIKGNIQWITKLWPQILRGDLPLFILSSRRFFRVAWGWWPVLFYLGFLLITGSFYFMAAVILQLISSLLFLIIMTRKNELASAFISSLLFFRWRDQLQWK